MESYKKGNCWKACYDKDTGKYLGYIVYTSREGQERYLYEISKDVFDRLGSFKDDYENDRLIKDEGKSFYRFENTMYGTLGPEESVYEEGGESIWDRAYKKIEDELEAKAEAGDEKALVEWLVNNQYSCGNDKKRKKIRHFMEKASDCGITWVQEKLANAYLYGDEYNSGIKKDLEKAAYWLAKAAEQGSKEAKKLLRKLKREGTE